MASPDPSAPLLKRQVAKRAKREREQELHIQKGEVSNCAQDVDRSAPGETCVGFQGDASRSQDLCDFVTGRQRQICPRDGDPYRGDIVVDLPARCCVPRPKVSLGVSYPPNSESANTLGLSEHICTSFPSTRLPALDPSLHPTYSCSLRWLISPSLLGMDEIEAVDRFATLSIFLCSFGELDVACLHSGALHWLDELRQNSVGVVNAPCGSYYETL